MDSTLALMLVSTASNVAKLFGSGGGSAGRIQQLQMDMLLTISRQIDVVQKEIRLLFSRLDELKQLLEQLPDELVLNLYQKRGYGLVTLFQEHMRGYIAHRDATTLEDAQREYAPLIESEILVPLREVRSVLLNTDDPILVPPHQHAPAHRGARHGAYQLQDLSHRLGP